MTPKKERKEITGVKRATNWQDMSTCKTLGYLTLKKHRCNISKDADCPRVQKLYYSHFKNQDHKREVKWCKEWKMHKGVCLTLIMTLTLMDCRHRKDVTEWESTGGQIMAWQSTDWERTGGLSTDWESKGGRSKEGHSTNRKSTDYGRREYRLRTHIVQN